MDGSQGSSNAPAPFLVKTYEMVDDQSTNSMVSWSQSGCSFIVFNPTEFSVDLLPKHFKHNNFSSFVRQLNTYGFRKIDPDQWEFANEEFVRGQRHLLNNIHRRKPIHSHSLQNQGNFSTPLSEAEKQQYEEEIRRLKHDKNLLELELQVHERENQGFEFQRELLCERLQTMESRQRQLMVSLARVMQKPGFASILMQQSETYNKKRRLMNSNHCYEESNSEENWGLTFQNGDLDPFSFPTVNLELIGKLESSLNFWEQFLHGVDEALVKEAYDSGLVLQPSPVLVTEMHVSSGDPGMTDQPCSLPSHPSSLLSRDTRSSSEPEGSRTHVGSPVISTVCLNADFGPKSSGIDVNSEPTSAPEIEDLKEHGVGITALAVPAGVNDLFWEQFLTESPGLRETEKVEPERRETDSRMSDSKPADQRKFWWKANDLNNLTDREDTSLH